MAEQPNQQQRKIPELDEILTESKKNIVENFEQYEQAFKKNLQYILNNLIKKKPILGAFITSEGRLRRPEEIPEEHIAEILKYIAGDKVAQEYAKYSSILEITFPEIPSTVRNMLYRALAPLATALIGSFQHAYRMINKDLKELQDKLYSGEIKKGTPEYKNKIQEISNKFKEHFDKRFAAAVTAHYFGSMAGELVQGLIYAFNKMLEEDYETLYGGSSQG